MVFYKVSRIIKLEVGGYKNIITWFLKKMEKLPVDNFSIMIQ